MNMPLAASRRLPRCARHHRQRGAALLMAMLIVALVTTLIAAMAWQQWRGIETESAERARSRDAWLLLGVSDWSRLLLRADASTSKIDSLDEPWSVPLAEAQLSTFVASGHIGDDDDLPDAYLSGQIEDAQARLNVRDLASTEMTPSADWLAVFARLYATLGLDPAELTRVQANLVLALNAQVTRGTDGQPVIPQAGTAPLLPQTFDQLIWLGFSPAHLDLLRDYITILPVRTTVNVNTASAPVLQAVLGQIDQSDVQTLIASRSKNPIIQDEELLEMFPNLKQDDGVIARISPSTRFFLARGNLRSDRRTETDQTLIQRAVLDVRVLVREQSAGEASLSPRVSSR
ncbi:MAG: type II secretion system minor pseudopilin GspK [Pseudoxanthomonas sp.]